MDTLNIDKPIWKSKDGDIPISSMTDDHIQKAYNSAEYRFMKYENMAVNLSIKAGLFEDKLGQLEAEAKFRNIELNSVALKNLEKFGILRNRMKVKVME